MGLIKTLLLFGVGGYVLLIGAMYLFQRSLMYFPDARRVAPATAGLPQAEEVILTTSDGETLIAWYIPPRDRRPVVIYFQGNGGGLDLRADRFAWLTADGVGLLGLGYRGFSGSTGSPSEQGLIRDALAAYDFISGRYPVQHIVLWGESLGTGVAIALAAERPVAGVMLDAPFTSTADVGAAAYPFAPVRWFMKDQFRSDLRIAKVTAPILIMHGARDRVVPIAFGERLFALAHEPKRMVRLPNAEHADMDAHGRATFVMEFLARFE